jgi:hydroxyacylglutathione hydrolase
MVHTIAALSDNYIYAVATAAGAIIIDPSDAAPVIDWCHSFATKPIALWCTHHHGDHISGVRELVDRFGAMPVVGSVYDRTHGRILGQTHAAKDGETIEAGGVRAKVLEVPGHTLGAVAYLTGDGALFSGDTLFVSGCGRLFEGSADTMLASLRRLRALADDVRLYCGHEYAQKNIAFARSLTPEDAALEAYEQDVASKRARGQASVPGTLATEKRTNPMLRWDDDAIRKRVAGSSDVDTFAKVRSLRDHF